MDNAKKRMLRVPSDTGQFSKIVQGVARSDRCFFRRYVLPFFLFAAVVSIPVPPSASATNPGQSDNQDGITKTRVVLNIVPKKSEFECVVTIFWFLRLTARMAAMEGEFHTIPTNVNGNSKGFMKIYSDSLETITDQIAEKIRTTYLETEKYPEISFDLINLEGEHDSLLLPQEHRFKASGILKLHGIEKKIVFCPHIWLHDDVIEFKGETVVKLTDFGIKIPRYLFFEARDEVSIRFNVAWDYSPHLKSPMAEVVQ